MNAHASDATIIITHSIRKHRLFRYKSTALNGSLFDSPCGPGIYLPKTIKVEPDLSLLRDKFSVRYECEPSLEIDVNYIKSLFTFHYTAWFFRVFMLLNVFLSILRSLSSESFKKL